MEASSDFKFILRALKYKNYRLFFSGQLVSLIGTWLTTVATSWLVYRLARESGADAGKSALILGLVGFFSQVPQLLLGPIAGAWVDRLDRHRVLVATQSLSMIQSFLLAGLALTHTITIPAIIWLNVFQGLVNAFDMPARQALTVDLVEKREDLGNAIALSSSMVHAARLIGPAIAGYLIYHLGEGSCFLADGFSYLAVLLALLKMTIKKKETDPNRATILKSFREGIHYSWNFIPVRTLLLFIATTSLLIMPQQTLMPIFAQEILGGGEKIYGFLLCSAGFGALMGAGYLASRKSVLGLGRVIVRDAFLLGVGLILQATAKNFPVAALSLVITGFALIAQVASANTILQTIVDDSKRGRVMSLFGTAFLGMMPLGSLLAGWIASRAGTRWTLAISGIGCLLNAIIFSKQLPVIRKHVRPIYIRMGILAAALEESIGKT